jgi:hypothetical protein
VLYYRLEQNCRNTVQQLVKQNTISVKPNLLDEELTVLNKKRESYRCYKQDKSVVIYCTVTNMIYIVQRRESMKHSDAKAFSAVMLMAYNQ